MVHPLFSVTNGVLSKFGFADEKNGDRDCMYYTNMRILVDVLQIDFLATLLEY